MKEMIEPFTIAVPRSVLDDLRRRLEATRFPDQIPGTGWNYGTDVDYLRALVAHWHERFDWRAQERRLNRLDHYGTRIDGQWIHFVHARSRHPGAMPLLLLHGWPSTFVEFLKVIGPLSEPERNGAEPSDGFHVVCPSLPGYGFSEVTRTAQWDPRRMSEAFAELMHRLGYRKYGVQGGDWGALIATELALRDREHVHGIHLNMPLAVPQPDRSGLSKEEKADLQDMARIQREETGYQKIQGTKPQTLGFALNDSPAGLAAWIVEKFRAWSDCGGDVESVFTKDELLTNITIYWVTGTITSSVRLYCEFFQGRSMGFATERIEVPTGVARFPGELTRFPRRWVEQHYNVTRWTKMARGGHFAAQEQPELFVDDVRAFFRELRSP
jgi:microsomal epoxide hydrolase